ncbi:hypothetical protein mRhiFer1_009334 [Rhinolophus ferrumequinum]|uniref:Uncharacterized protein n=1 Tax=Rhinolophus ferrumequinum TaxID=59479 RepID=A0A7J7RXQ3_RHIFE|nr:hypothetical protein mRhiFer1_009334 [Rhinolophus ferrumequinum]
MLSGLLFPQDVYALMVLVGALWVRNDSAALRQEWVTEQKTRKERKVRLWAAGQPPAPPTQERGELAETERPQEEEPPVLDLWGLRWKAGSGLNQLTERGLRIWGTRHALKEVPLDREAVEYGYLAGCLPASP